MRFLFHLAAAVSLTVLQIAFLSHLPAPFSSVTFAAAAIAAAILAERPLEGAWWALAAGLTLDLHGLFGFGAETLALFASLWVGRKAFRRLLTNASAASPFLVTATVVAARWGVLAALDSLRALFGRVPLLLVDARSLRLPFYEMAVDGLLVVAASAAFAAVRAGFRKNFLSAHAVR